MKKVFLVLSAGFLIALSACSGKKDWTCTCTVSSSGTSVKQDYPLLQLTEDEAKTKCEVKALTGNSSGSCTQPVAK